MELHPAWPSVRQIERIMAAVGGIPAPLEPPALVLAEGKLPPPLPLSPGRSANHTLQDRYIVRLAHERIEDLQAWLDTRNERVLAREQQALQNALETDVAHVEGELREKARTEAEALRAKERVRILDLQLKQVAYRSQVAALSGPPRIEAEARLAAVKKELAAGQADLAGKLAAISNRADAEVQEYRARRQAEMALQLQSRRMEMEQEARQIIARYETRLGAGLSRIDPLELPPVPPLPPAKGPGMRAPAEMAVPHILPTRPVDVNKVWVDLTAQRSRLVRTISDEVRRRVQQLAKEKHWKVSFEPKPDLEDITQQVAVRLRDSLRPGPASISFFEK